MITKIFVSIKFNWIYSPFQILISKKNVINMFSTRALAYHHITLIIVLQKWFSNLVLTVSINWFVMKKFAGDMPVSLLRNLAFRMSCLWKMFTINHKIHLKTYLWQSWIVLYCPILFCKLLLFCANYLACCFIGYHIPLKIFTMTLVPLTCIPKWKLIFVYISLVLLLTLGTMLKIVKSKCLTNM